LIAATTSCLRGIISGVAASDLRPSEMPPACFSWRWKPSSAYPCWKPMWQWRVISMTKKDKNVLDGLQKLEESDLLLQQARCSSSLLTPKQQLDSYMRAIEIRHKDMDFSVDGTVDGYCKHFKMGGSRRGNKTIMGVVVSPSVRRVRRQVDHWSLAKLLQMHCNTMFALMHLGHSLAHAR
jgi:hypothetical protein